MRETVVRCNVCHARLTDEKGVMSSWETAGDRIHFAKFLMVGNGEDIADICGATCASVFLQRWIDRKLVS